MRRVWNELQFNDSAPLSVRLRRLLSRNHAVVDDYGIVHSRRDKIPELPAATVEGSNMQADANINQCQRHQLSHGVPAFD